MARARLALYGSALILAGLLFGVVYPYLLLFAGEDVAILVIRLSLAAVSILLGAFLASVGATLLVGWRLFYAEDTGEEQEGR